MFGINQPDIPEIDASDVYTSIQNKGDAVIVDVRTPQEFSRGKITGSINVPVDTIDSKIEKAAPDKNKTTYVYCLSGSRSAMAVGAMVKMGYKKVFSMKSGLLAWRSKGYSLQNG